MFKTYLETFDHDRGGWMAWLGQNQPAFPEQRDGMLISHSPWGIDSNHAPPGGGYLHLLFILFTAPQPTPGPLYAPLMGGNRFIEGGYSTDLRNARLTVRLKGEVNLKGAQLVLLCQARVGKLASNYVLVGQPFAITPDWSEQTVMLVPDPEQWLCLGARHDLLNVYGCDEIEAVLRDVNIDIIFVLHPLNILPMEAEEHGAHYRRPEVHYAVDRTLLPTGYVMLDEVRIEYPSITCG
jgi:hypothetical protein